MTNRIFKAFDVVLLLTWCFGFTYMYDVVCRGGVQAALFYLPFTPFIVILMVLSAAAFTDCEPNQSHRLQRD